jgi:hypothetical protein
MMDSSRDICICASILMRFPHSYPNVAVFWLLLATKRLVVFAQYHTFVTCLQGL